VLRLFKGHETQGKAIQWSVRVDGGAEKSLIFGEIQHTVSPSGAHFFQFIQNVIQRIRIVRRFFSAWTFYSLHYYILSFCRLPLASFITCTVKCFEIRAIHHVQYKARKNCWTEGSVSITGSSPFKSRGKSSQGKTVKASQLQYERSSPLVLGGDRLGQMGRFVLKTIDNEGMEIYSLDWGQVLYKIILPNLNGHLKEPSPTLAGYAGLPLVHINNQLYPLL
jgi:hypothetical protein